MTGIDDDAKELVKQFGPITAKDLLELMRRKGHSARNSQRRILHLIDNETFRLGSGLKLEFER